MLQVLWPSYFPVLLKNIMQAPSLQDTRQVSQIENSKAYTLIVLSFQESDSVV